MQRLEDYRLMGISRPDPTPVPSTVDCAEVRRLMAEVRKRDEARRAATTVSAREPEPARSARRPAEPGPFERRPAGMTLGRGGAAQARNGARGVAWALRMLQRMPEWEMRAEFERDPGTARELVASLDRLLVALEADAC